MALIDEYIRQIRNAIYGKDVRAAIANGIYQCYQDVSDSVDRANTAAQNADSKANLANSKAAAADAAASTAYQASSSATSAANNANAVATKLNGLTASASSLAAGSSPTAQVSEVNGHKHITLGIPKGDKGDKGKDFHIAKTFASIAAMNAYTSATVYDYAMIDTGNVQDVDTGKLYCFEEDRKWHYIGDLSGAQGIKGETGTGISSVTLNSDYTLTILYTNGTSVTTASIRGETGAAGNGIEDIRINADNSVTIVLDDGTEYTTEPVRGPQGETGPQGATGPQGEIGPGIERIQMNSDYTLTIFLENGTDYTTPYALQGVKGDTGTGVDHIALNSDYTLTIFFTDGTQHTTASIRGAKGDTGNGVSAITMNSDYTLTFTLDNGSQYTTDPIRGETGATGNGIESVELNSDYTLTITFTDGTDYTTSSIRGAQGPRGEIGSTPNFSIGTVSTLNPDQQATASIGGTAENPVLNLGIPRGQTGTVEDVYGTNIPVSESDPTTVKQALDRKLESVPVMTGASTQTAGVSGLAPAPAAGENTKFLRGDASYALPGVVTINGHSPDDNGDISAAEKSEAISNITRSGTTFTATRADGTTFTFTQQDNNTTYSAASDGGLSLSGTAFSLASSGATAGSYGPSANVTGSNNATMSVPYITIDSYGRVTSISNKTYTSKDTTYSLPLAANGTRGGVQIGYSTSGKNYAVALSGEKMYVNVPWTDNNTTYAAGTGLNLSSCTFSAKLSSSLTTTDATTALNLTGAKSLNDKITNCAPKFKSLWSGTVKTATTTTFTHSGYGFFLVVYLTGSMYGTKYIPGGSGEYCLETFELTDTYGLTVYQRMISINSTSFVTKDAYYTRSGTNRTKYNDAVQIKYIYGVA